LIFDSKLSFLQHIRYLENKSIKYLSLIRVVAHTCTSLGTGQDTILLLYTALIRSKLDYGCIVYGSPRSSYLRMLDPVQNHALRLCLDAYRTSPSSSLACLRMNLLYTYDAKTLYRGLQYCLKLSTSTHNPAYNTVFNCKFKGLSTLNPTRYPLWAFDCSRSYTLLDLRKKMYALLSPI